MARNRMVGKNEPAKNGIIESVTMVNFMCHDRLRVELGPLINFIIGKNGSGKSAILTAITLCLGGKASTTNRGGSLKSFIKGDRDSAQLIIELKNQGEGAYQHDVFGDLITVERNFTKNGSSGFRLRSASGRTISNKKQDVDDVVEWFQMQIDNPMNILTQDTARQFLPKSTPTQKYKFFLKGVQLEQLSNDYQLLYETTENLQRQLHTQEENVKVLEKVSTEKKQKAEAVKQHTQLKNKSKELLNQNAWSQVQDQEKILQTLGEAVEEHDQGVREAERIAAEKDEVLESYNQKLEEVETMVQGLQTELVPLTDAMGQAKIEYDTAATLVKSTHQELQQLRAEMTTAKKQADDIRRQIEQEQERIETANGGGHARKMKELEDAKGQAQEARASFDASRNTSHLESEHQRAIEALQKNQEPLKNKRNEIRDAETQLNDLNRNRGEIMSAFERGMPNLLKMIDQEVGFRQKPVGPIGMHVKLLHPKWVDVVERVIGSHLNAFVVTSKADHTRLSDLMKRAGVKSPILIGNNHPINTSGNEPDQNHLTILRALEIDNELVRNQLIIVAAIEQNLLVEKRTEALAVMFDGPEPRKVRSCYCLHDHRIGYGFSIRRGKNKGTQSIAPIEPIRRASRMRTNIDSQIAMRKDVLDQLRRDLQGLEARQRELSQDVQKKLQAINQQKRAQGDLKLQLDRAEERVDRLEEELDSLNVEDGRLEQLREELEEQELKVSVHEGSYGEAALTKEMQGKTAENLKDVLAEAKALVQQHNAKISKAQEKMHRISGARRVFLTDKNKALVDVQEAQEAKAKAEKQLQDQQAVVDNFTAQASEICPRVVIDSGETSASITAKYRSIKQQLEMYRRRQGGSDEEIQNASIEAQESYEAARDGLENEKAMLDLLKQTREDRILKWRMFQRFISARARINFMYLLSERGFRGSLLLDHKHKALDLHIEPDETTKSAKGRAAKTLSGGEKSFSSICLLLSLWEAMGAPLRCLDEFDVFMDQVNRDVSIRMIVSIAL